MSVGFRAVQWNRAKIVYDAVVIACAVVFILGFAAVAWATHAPKSLPDVIDIWIRAFGTTAFLMLTVILCIGPLARLNPRLLPLLYNRRHLGVVTFLVALTHVVLMLEWFRVQGLLGTLPADFLAWGDYLKFIGFPFKTLGLAALTIMFVMAATSHDFWLAFLRPPVWKAIHMAVYAAYALVVMHVALGLMQYEHSPLIPFMLIGSLALVGTLQLIAGWREPGADRGGIPAPDGWLTVGPPASIPDKAARIVAAPGGERIAVFRDGDEIGALTNLCAHQNGPLGEGRIIDGCVTCPWHGYQYRLSDGCAPPPFTERLATYRLRLKDGMVEVDPRPLPPGTPASITCPRA
jgi:nitrite reductase/ring-hydroxylating ferredoxin subunit/DMSO/TMAO reductase YedYZ heme-binding membrane subunit